MRSQRVWLCENTFAAHLVFVFWRKAKSFCCCFLLRAHFFVAGFARPRPLYLHLFHKSPTVAPARVSTIVRESLILSFYFYFFIFIYFFLFFEKSKNTLVSFDLVLLFVLKRSLCIWVFSWVFHIRGTASRIDRPRIIISPHYPSIFLSQFGC